MNITGDSKNAVNLNIARLGATNVRYFDDETGYAALGDVAGKRTLIGEAFERDGQQIVNLTTEEDIVAMEAVATMNPQ